VKKALVTGGTRGIGAATAKALLQDGYEVIVSGSSPNGRVLEGCAYEACDFSDPVAVDVFAATISKWELSVLINNAGINKIGPLQEYDPSDFARIQQVNVTAPFKLCQAVVPGMCKRQHGRIVNITSIYGVVSRVGRSAYSVSKFGLFGLTRALALEVARDNVLVNGLAPGIVETALARQMLGEKGLSEIITRIPMGRLAAPEEIARTVRFLCSEDNTYMTGQNIVVDGGYTCG
jgi:NAD(P)-dependent dehydrogenase (short-subunit alcohol dehydrogenase family)